MIESVSVQKVLEETLVLIQEKFKKANIKLTVDTRNDCDIKCVPTLLSQVLINLLNNSFDAIQASSKPWVKIIMKSGKDNIKITVMDSGAGIPADVQKFIMEPFFTTKTKDGTGLGLSISRDIIEVINGKLYYELINKNTAFTIELPCSEKV
jgi:C4-dicarboxylate-specific signal transduction histidine kinase